MLCAVIYLRNNLNNVQIATIFYGKVRHLRAEAKSMFYKAACGTSEFHYGLRQAQHQEGRLELGWQKSKEHGVVVPMVKEVKAAFSLRSRKK